MIKANQIYYLQNANDSISVFMRKESDKTTYRFYNQEAPDSPRLKIALFTVNKSIVVCYELSANGIVFAEDTSDLLHPNIVPGLIAAIFFDVFK